MRDIHFLFYLPAAEDNPQDIRSIDADSPDSKADPTGSLARLKDTISYHIDIFSESSSQRSLAITVDEFDAQQCLELSTRKSEALGIWGFLDEQNVIFSAGDADPSFTFQTNEWFLPLATRRGLLSWISTSAKNSQQAFDNGAEGPIIDFLTVESTTKSQHYIQTYLSSKKFFILECRFGSSDEHYRTIVQDAEDVASIMIEWMDSGLLPGDNQGWVKLNLD